jgi:hypothetical protein
MVQRTAKRYKRDLTIISVLIGRLPILSDPATARTEPSIRATGSSGRVLEHLDTGTLFALCRRPVSTGHQESRAAGGDDGPERPSSAARWSFDAHEASRCRGFPGEGPTSLVDVGSFFSPARSRRREPFLAGDLLRTWAEGRRDYCPDCAASFQPLGRRQHGLPVADGQKTTLRLGRPGTRRLDDSQGR